MSQTKDNHFVPRFYLRNFTKDPTLENGWFDFYNLKGQKHLGEIPHGSQMQERYYYEKDSEIEKMLGEKFEGKHAALIRGLIDGSEEPNEEWLIEMMLLMHFRTRAQRDENLAFRKHMIDTLLDNMVRSFKRYLQRDVPWLLSRIRDDQIKDIVRTGSYERYLRRTDTARKGVEHFLKIKEEVKGLRCVALSNTTQSPLVSSDRPVILLNPFLARKDVSFGRTGLFQMGIVLILPINPSKIIVCYDSGIYEQINETSVLTTEDVANINRLEILVGVEGIYSIILPNRILSAIPEICREKRDPQIVNVELPGDYLLTYKDYMLPTLALSFLREKKGTDQISLRLPYQRATTS